MIKLVISIILCFFVNFSYASIDNRPGITEPIVELNKPLLIALDAAISECKYRGFSIELGGVKVYRNAKNYIFDFGVSIKKKLRRGVKPGTKMVVIVDANTFNVVVSYPPR